MGWVLSWLVCAIATGLIASMKGRDSRRWGLWGVLLGPLGVLIALVVPQDRQAKEARARSWR